MRPEWKSIIVQSQFCGDTRIVVLVVMEHDRKLIKAISNTIKKIWMKKWKIAFRISVNAIFIATGLWLTSKAVDSAYEFRGYEAIGGEYLVLPVFLIAVEVLKKAIRCIVKYREEM